MFRISATFYGIFLTFYFIPLKNLVTNEVCFINVGQGDSCLIRKGTLSVLIDTGGLTYTDVATNTLIPFFKKKKIYNLDLVITTHDDYDHKGALDSLLKNFNVKKYVSSYELFPYNIGNLSFKNYNTYQTSWTEENDKSLVIGFNLNNKNYLIMGDAPKKIERLIMNDYLNIPCDIIKVGHHGSNTSSDDDFIKHLNPKEAVISVGQNKFGHPHKEVLSILSKNNIKVRRTDEEGTIIY